MLCGISIERKGKLSVKLYVSFGETERKIMYQNCCKKCGSISLHTEQKGNSIGLYCDDCGAWIKWLGKDELRAFEHAKEVVITTNNQNNNDKSRQYESMQDSYLNIKGQLIKFVDFLEQTIDNEMDIMPLSTEDAIRKSSYCLALERDKNAIYNILNGRDFNYVGD